MTRPLLPAVEPSNGTGSVPSRPGSEHGARVAPTVARVGRIAGLLRELAVEVQELSRELEDCLAAGAGQSDVMTVRETQESTTTRLISAGEVASRIGVSATTVRRWRRDRILPPGITVAGIVRWDPADIDAWIIDRKECGR